MVENEAWGKRGGEKGVSLAEDENVPKLIFGDGYTSLNRLEATEVYMVWNHISIELLLKHRYIKIKFGKAR